MKVSQIHIDGESATVTTTAREATAQEATKQAFKDAKRERVIIEHGDDGWLIMFADGSIVSRATATEALALVKTRAARANRGVTLTTLEWRNAPAGFTPPTGA